MKKILYLIIIALCIPISTFGLELPNTHSKIIMIYDLTDDKILLEKNSQQKSNIASLTKIMTTITAIELNDDLSKKVTITENMLMGIPADASIAHLKVGSTYTLEDLLYASMLPSGADATQAIAYSTKGSISNFVKEMNKLAKKIGVTNTNFVNVTGLDVDNHYSTASDIAKLLKYALENKTFKKIYCTKEYILSDNQKVLSTIKMYSQKLNIDPTKIIGSKTGFTSKAGTCLSALIDVLDHEVLLITLQAPYVSGDYYNIRDGINLINFLEKNYHYEEIISKETFVKDIKVELSKQDNLHIKTKDNYLKFLPQDYNRELVRLEYEGTESIDYNHHVGESLGKINYYYDNELLTTEEVTLDIELEPDVIKIINKYRFLLISLFGIFILLLICIILLIKRSKKRKQ